ncbi:MAG: hypothetical protein A2341_22320 [Deltaproteobacteria bacterium RIFOXYB12_FULL_58_9]|nr:MAG: hypothetical protein A2341_22320 [Deltaproteobacteria bacterium RIFOXYB12_FULL_58_9]
MQPTVSPTSHVNQKRPLQKGANDHVSDQTRMVAFETRDLALSPTVQPKVLVVEDDAAIARAYVRAGRASGYEVIATSNGRDAIELAVSEKPHAIILDIGLPGLDGRDVMVMFNSMGITANTVVVIVSGHDQQHDRVAGLRLGAHDYETKPVRADLLFSKVGRLLEKMRAGAI